jgi:hypothetical protein
MRNEGNNPELEPHERKQPHFDLRLMELAGQNPSLGGRELLIEIIGRGPGPEEAERPHARDARATFGAQRLDDPDYRSQPEHADWIGSESKLTRDLYERGAEIKNNVLILPAEEYEISEDRETPFITTLSYAFNKIKDAEKAAEFHSLAKKISGETADVRTEIIVFKTFYDRLTSVDRGSQLHEESRQAELSQTLDEMWRLATEMERLETRESIEVDGHEELLDETRGMDFSDAARKVRLDEESFRFPAGLSQEARERLISVTIPEIDRRLESGVSRVILIAAIDGSLKKRSENDGRDLSDRDQSDSAKIAGFLKNYIDERLRDPETRALNTSDEFRRARAEFLEARTSDALGKIAERFLRLNQQRGEELRLHLLDPARHPRPETTPLDARNRSLLFNGRAPAHHTREMRELRINYGLSRANRASRTEQLHQKRVDPSRPLGLLVDQLEIRRTVRSVSHFQANLLNAQLNQDGKLNIHQLYNSLPPHERAYLFERSENRKRNFEITPDRSPQSNLHESPNGRAFGEAPRGSKTLREYLTHMGRIERQLLNQEIRRHRPNIIATEDRDGMTITEARSLLPEQSARDIRMRARSQAWEQIVPSESFERNPPQESIRISDTIAYIQEHLQESARIAQNARNEFLAEKIREAERRNGIRESISKGFSPPNPIRRREDFVQSVIASLGPEDARKFAALDHYAAKTREEVYLGFEAIDSQRRNLELVLARSDMRSDENHNPPRMAEIRSQNQAQVSAYSRQPILSMEPYPRMSDERDRYEAESNMTVDPGFINSNLEWRIDSLRDAFNPGTFGRTDSEIERIGYPIRGGGQDRTMDR